MKWEDETNFPRRLLAQPGGVFYRMCTVKNARINKDGLTTLGIPVETFLKSGKVIRGEKR